MRADTATARPPQPERSTVSRQQAVAEINRAASARSLTPAAIIATAVLVLTLAASGLALPAGIALLAGAWVVGRAHRSARKRGVYPLLYELDEPTGRQFAARVVAVQALGRAERLWNAGGSDWKAQRPHEEELTANGPSNVRIGLVQPRCIRTNVEVVGIAAGSDLLLFFPDQILVLRAGRYHGVAYETLTVDCSSLQVTSYVDPPKDATVLGQAWGQSRGESNPGRGYSSSARSPVVQYAQLSLRAPEGLDLTITVSNAALAFRCAEALQQGTASDQSADQRRAAGAGPTRSGSARPGATAGGQRRGQRPRGALTTAAATQYAAACAVLNVTPNASADEVRAAYRRMARQYHPDTVASTAPELVAVAERRMREINAAYAILSRPKAG